MVEASSFLFHAVRDADGLSLILKTPAASSPGPREHERYRKHKLLQILINLISSAKNAMAALSQGDRTMHVRLEVEGGKARIHVVDNGVGIAPEVRERLFAPTLELPLSEESSRSGRATQDGLGPISSG